MKFYPLHFQFSLADISQSRAAEKGAFKKSKFAKKKKCSQTFAVQEDERSQSILSDEVKGVQPPGTLPPRPPASSSASSSSAAAPAEPAAPAQAAAQAAAAPAAATSTPPLTSNSDEASQPNSSSSSQEHSSSLLSSDASQGMNDRDSQESVMRGEKEKGTAETWIQPLQVAFTMFMLLFINIQRNIKHTASIYAYPGSPFHFLLSHIMYFVYFM